MTDFRGLDGLVVGVPAARMASDTARLVERFGGRPLVGPTVEEVGADDEATLRATEHIVRDGVSWSVHLTGVGTRRWFDVAAGAGLRDRLIAALRGARLVARGPKSRAALHESGLEPDWTPPEETSGAIGAWLSPRIDSTDVVAVQRHGDPSRGLLSDITGSGAILVEVAPYRWSLPPDRAPAERLAAAVARGGVDILLVTSAPQIRHLLELSGHIGLGAEVRQALCHQVFVAAIGEVAASAVRDCHIPVDLVAQPSRLVTLIRSVAGARDRVADKRRSARVAS